MQKNISISFHANSAAAAVSFGGMVLTLFGVLASFITHDVVGIILSSTGVALILLALNTESTSYKSGGVL